MIITEEVPVALTTMMTLLTISILTKRFYDGRKRNGKYQIRVPLNSNRPVTVNRDENQFIPNRILGEIQTAFSNKKKRETFVKEISKVLGQYPVKNEENAQKDRVFDALKKIANGFDLGWDDEQITKYLRKTQTKGGKYIALLTKQDYTYYLAYETNQYVVADYKKVGHRYVGEWERI